VDATQPSLRGPDARSISGRFWTVSCVLLLTLFAVIIVATFISATNDNARIDRLKSHGVSVAVTVTSCVGNIGGSGSNAAGYTCRGTYRVNDVRYEEIIGSKTTLSPAGTEVRAVADPNRPSTVELATAVARSTSSSSAYVVPSVLALVFVVLALALFRRQRSFDRSKRR
jgi:hypothetical protein